jgi:hypothetical protein
MALVRLHPWLAGQSSIWGCRANSTALPVSMSAPSDCARVPLRVSLAQRGSYGPTRAAESARLILFVFI